MRKMSLAKKTLVNIGLTIAFVIVAKFLIAVLM